MSIRDDLAQIIFEAMDWVDPTDDIEQAGQDAEHLADAVLDWLGQLDPDADPELIAWHLKANADEIERLREALKTVAVAVNNMLKVDEWSGFCGWCEAAMSDHDGDCQMATLYELDALREVTP